MSDRRIDITPKPPQSLPNAALREIAGRLQRLSYADMITLVRVMNTTIPGDDRDITGDHVLRIAGLLEKTAI